MPQDNAGSGRKSSEAAHVPEGAPVEKAQDVKSADDPNTSQQESELSSQQNALADRLGIPAEIQAELKRGEAESGNAENKREVEAGEGAPRKDSGLSDDQEVVGEEAEPEGDVESEGEGEEEGVEEEVEEEQEQGSPFKDPRVQKRLGKETRKRREAEERLAALEERLANTEGQQEQQNRGSDMASTLDNVRTERELNQMVNAHEARLEFCDAHADGVEGDDHTRPILDEKGRVTGYEKKFYEPAEIAKIRRESERTLLKAERTRGRIREFGAQLQKWNGTAKEIYPELFPSQEQLKDQDASEEYYYAVSLVQAAPQIFGSLPEANLLLGDLAFAKKCRDNPAAALPVLQKRAAAIGRNGSQPSTKNPPASAVDGLRRGEQPSPDIPPLLRKKQPPLAPHTAGRPTSHAGPNAARKVDGAIQNAIDQGGDRDAISAAIGAIHAAKQQEPRSRMPVMS